MRIGIVGSGSMGCVFGGKMKRAGHDVVLYDQDARTVAAIERKGLSVTDPSGCFTTAIAATTDPSELSNLELCVVLVDNNATAQVAPLLLPMMATNGVALTLQNGIGNVEALTAILGFARVLGGSTYVSAAMIAPGHAHNTNIGETVIGELDGTLTKRALHCANVFSGIGLPTEASGNIMGHIWSKFALNCAINPLCALTGLRPAEIVRNPALSHLLDTVIAEIMAVVQAMGVSLPHADPARHIRDHAFMRYNRPSMLQHLEAGRRTEIAGLNAALVPQALALGVATPANATITALVQGIEARLARGALVDEAALEAAASLAMPVSAMSQPPLTEVKA